MTRSTWKALIDEVNDRAERQREVHAAHLSDLAVWLRDTGYPTEWRPVIDGELLPVPACMVVPLARAHRERDLARKAAGEIRDQDVEPLEDYIDFIAAEARGEITTEGDAR